ncbi:hypothetical protein KCP69_04835 [Salmonella enterica subsp. enterica]|nr:hypothetical protein KCP69_04835 [Salmonella enterica subsp. enterica]
MRLPTLCRNLPVTVRRCWSVPHTSSTLRRSAVPRPEKVAVLYFPRLSGAMPLGQISLTRFSMSHYLPPQNCRSGLMAYHVSPLEYA